MVKVRFFASLGEQFGVDEVQLAEGAGMSVEDVWQATAGQPLPEHVLSAVNLEYTPSNTIVAEGDEIAFFPPVTGG